MNQQNLSHKVIPASTVLHYLDVFEFFFSVYSVGRQSGNEISPLWMFPFDFESDTTVFCAYQGMEIVGTITINSQKILPFEDYFYRQDLEQLQDRTVAEISRLIIKETYPQKVALLNELFSWAYLYATNIHNTSDFIIEVSKRHADFYEKVLGFTFLTQTTRPFDSSSDEIVLLRGDLDKVKNNPEKYSFIETYNTKAKIAETLKNISAIDHKENLKKIQEKFYSNYPQPIVEFALPQKKSGRSK